MPVADVNYNAGGADAQPNQGNPSDLSKVLRSLIDDIAQVKASTIAAPAAPVAAVAYTQADLQLMVNLINEMRTALIAIAATVQTTTKV